MDTIRGCGLAVVRRLRSVARASLAVSQGARAVFGRARVDTVGGPLAGLGTVIPSFRSFVSRLRCPVVSICSFVPALSRSVSVLSCPS